MDVNQLLKLMAQKEISDIHFKAEGVPALRIGGKMVPAQNLAKLGGEDVRKIAYQLMTPDQAKRFESEHELDLAYSLEGVSRFRVNVYRQRGTIGLTLRLVPLKVRSFEDLHLPRALFERLAMETRGLILFAGITGAGKTTSMNCFIQHLNDHFQYRIVTIEDPIEYYHQDVRSSIVQREVGHDTHSFHEALRHVLRQDPDVIVVGEMRDAEAMQAALVAAETGHLVLSTIHTMDAVQTIERIIDAHPAHQHTQVRQQLANTLKAVVCQRLVASANGSVRYPAVEVLTGNNMVRRSIAEGKTQELYKIMESGSYYGMQTFDQDLVRLVQATQIDSKTAVEHATRPEDLSLKLSSTSAGAGSV